MNLKLPQLSSISLIADSCSNAYAGDHQWALEELKKLGVIITESFGLDRTPIGLEE